MKKLLIITKKWADVNEAKFSGKAHLVGELENDEEYLVWDFNSCNLEEAQQIFGKLLIKHIEIEI